MHVRIEEFRDAWLQIEKESLSHSTCRVVVFVACLDVDALCAARMLSALLKKRLITHKTVPVAGYSSLREAYSRLDEAVRNVFCVGCGATMDLDELLELETNGKNARLHVFDSHRPWHLNNLYGSEHVFCYDDGDFDQLEPYREAYEFLAENAAEEDSVESEEESDGSASGEGGDEMTSHSRKRGRGPRAVASDSEPDSDTEDTQPDDNEIRHEDSDQAPKPSRKRRATRKHESMRLLEDYYVRGSQLFSTNAVLMYTLMFMIGETSLFFVWLASIGVTSVEPQHPQLYKTSLSPLREEMRRLNEAANGAEGRGQSTISRRVTIHTESDYSLFLLRQWSLYESMIHSSYVSAKLYLWREDGRKKLHKLLARIGITLQDSQQTWIHMKPQLKRELKPKLDSVSGIYDIEGITRPGIVRRFGLDGTMSAGDCAESVAALLEAGDPDQYSMDKLQRKKSSEEDDSVSNFSSLDLENGAASTWAQHFWLAWDAIDNFARLRAGTQQAKMLQRAVVATGNSIFENNLPKDLNPFRMVIVQEAPELEIFLNPLSLQRLGVWISEGCAEIHTVNLPLILALLDEKRDVFLVLGMSRYRSRDDHQDADTNADMYNTFGPQFQAAAAAINAKIRIDGFDSAIIEVARDDLFRFLSELYAKMRS